MPRLLSIVACLLCTVQGSDDVAWVFESDKYANALKQLAPSWEIQHCFSNQSCTDPSKVRAVIGRAAAALDRLPSLQLVQSTDYFYPDLSTVPLRAAVANFQTDWKQYGASPIAEWCVAAMFDFLYGLRRHHEAFTSCAWSDLAPSSCEPASTQTTHRTFKELTVGIVGYGTIGSEVAVRAAALGASVVASKPSGPYEPPPSPLKWLSPDNDRVFKESHVVVIAVPGSLAGFVNRTSLGLMQPGALLIPTSAGPINQNELLEALQQRQTSLFASLDEWGGGCWHYPNTSCGSPYGEKNWPGSLELAKLPNVLATPGMAMRDDLYWENSTRAVARNLVALSHGMALSGVVRNATS